MEENTQTGIWVYTNVARASVSRFIFQLGVVWPHGVPATRQICDVLRRRPRVREHSRIKYRERLDGAGRKLFIIM